ncbi:MAG: UDP-N-acetylmuramoyl-tripeptide--D-alanyl-D-alanine ligase, partial [Bacteroidota bacterium]
AAGIVVDEPIGKEGENNFHVEDVLTTLQKLALHHRSQFQIPFIAITGSNGKTTTKELVHAVLSSQYKTYTTKGNLNNHIGVPLTLLSIKEDAEMAIIEMGANHQKEIASYCEIAQPTHGIITNCGKAHMEGFGGVEGIRKGKGELFDFISSTQGTAFVNCELDYLMGMSQSIKQIIWYGQPQGSFRSSVFQNDPLLALEIENSAWGKQRIFSRLAGAYNKPNIDVAICVGNYFGIPFATIRNAIEAYQPDNARSQLIKKNKNTIILDAYNANPNSMQAAIDNLIKQPAPHKYFLLGAMMELGEDSIKEHQHIVDLLVLNKMKQVVLVGGDFEKTNHPYRYFKSSEDASEWLKKNLPTHSTILIKGSRSIKMEKLAEVL